VQQHRHMTATKRGKSPNTRCKCFC